MAAKSKARPRAEAQPKPNEPDYSGLVHDLFEIDALLAGADSILRDIHETGTGPAGDLTSDVMNASKLVRQAIERIPPLAERLA